MARVEWLVVGGAVEPWRAPRADRRRRHGPAVRHRHPHRPRRCRPGSSAGRCRAIADDVVVDRRPADRGRRGRPRRSSSSTRCGAIGLDHVVVTTDSLERTCGAIADATGAPLRRVREVGEIRQGFHRLGGAG